MGQPVYSVYADRIPYLKKEFTKQARKNQQNQDRLGYFPDHFLGTCSHILLGDSCITPVIVHRS